jgi:hypothetical protein
VALALCRALTVLCVAPDADTLRQLKRATVSADWELAPGATDLRAALDQIDDERPHVLVAFGSWDELIRLTRDRFPGMRIVTDRGAPGATAVASSPEEVRSLVKGLPRPGGPVG